MMRKIWVMLFLCAWVTVVGAQQQEEDNPLNQIQWQDGPSIGDLGVADIRVPAGYSFCGADDTRLLMEAMENTVSNTEMGLLSPPSLDWYIIFEYDNVGYIRDDEKNDLDADAMLQSIQEGTQASNAERKKRGWSTMTIRGWYQKPQYDEKTHNLEWAIQGDSEGDSFINFNTRLLGRGGVMTVTLVGDPAEMPTIIPKFKSLLGGYDFKDGQRYAEYREGDKLAQYGLTALVVGGAAVAAAKSGAFRGLWKLIVFGSAAVAALFKKIFGRKS